MHTLFTSHLAGAITLLVVLLASTLECQSAELWRLSLHPSRPKIHTVIRDAVYLQHQEIILVGADEHDSTTRRTLGLALSIDARTGGVIRTDTVCQWTFGRYYTGDVSMVMSVSASSDGTHICVPCAGKLPGILQYPSFQRVPDPYLDRETPGERNIWWSNYTVMSSTGQYILLYHFASDDGVKWVVLFDRERRTLDTIGTWIDCAVYGQGWSRRHFAMFSADDGMLQAAGVLHNVTTRRRIAYESARDGSRYLISSDGRHSIMMRMEWFSEPHPRYELVIRNTMNALDCWKVPVERVSFDNRASPAGFFLSSDDRYLYVAQRHGLPSDPISIVARYSMQSRSLVDSFRLESIGTVLTPVRDDIVFQYNDSIVSAQRMELFDELVTDVATSRHDDKVSFRHGMITIDTDQHCHGEWSVIVSDLIGRSLSQHDLKAEGGTVRCDLSGLSAGAYRVTASNTRTGARMSIGVVLD